MMKNIDLNKEKASMAFMYFLLIVMVIFTIAPLLFMATAAFMPSKQIVKMPYQ